MVGKGSATATAFKNSSNRRIYQGEKGGFFVLKDGKKIYSPKAAFRQVGDGNKAKVTRGTANVPTPLRRAVRKNAGTKRGPRAATLARGSPRTMMKAGLTPNAGDLTRMLLKSPKARKPRSNKGVPRKAPSGAKAMMKAGLTPNEGDLTRMLFATPKARKPRSNKGVARKPKASPKPMGPLAMMRRGLTPNEGNLTRKLFASPKPRGPREGTLLRRMNAESKKIAAKRAAGRKVRSDKGVRRKAPTGAKAMMKAGLTPEEGNLFRMLFATPKTRKPRSNKGKARKTKATPKPTVNIFVSPGGTALTKRQIAGRKAAATRKARTLTGNPFAALA